MHEQDEDPAVAAAAALSRRLAHRSGAEVRERFGVDVAAPATATGTARDATARADTLRRQADVQRDLARDDRSRAAELGDVADTTSRSAGRADHAVEDGRVDPQGQDRSADGIGSEAAAPEVPVPDAHVPDAHVPDAAREGSRVAYDSGERRDAWAADLERRGVDRELVAGRLRSDVSNARPATHATLSRTAAGRTTGHHRAAAARTRTAGAPAQTR